MKSKSFIILGLGRFGRSIAETLHAMGHDVLAVDKCEERINMISSSITHAVVGDATDENFLKSLGARNFDAAVVAIGGEIQSSILSTMLLKEAGVKHVWAKARNELHSKVLSKIGADRIILPEKDMGVRVAHNLISTNILELIELSSEYSIVEIKPPHSWIGKSLKESNVRDSYGVSIMAVRNNSSIMVAPKSGYVINEDDTLVVIGLNTNINNVGELQLALDLLEKPFWFIAKYTYTCRGILKIKCA